MATFEEQFKAREDQAQQAAANQIDTSVDTQTKALQNAYEQNMWVQDDAAKGMANAYANANRQANNQLAMTRNTVNQFADRRNLNRQPGSQQALSLGVGAQQVLGSLAMQQKQAEAEAERQRELVKINNQNRVRELLAAGEYRKAAAVLDAYNNQESWLQQNAANLANYGDYSGYEALYGWDTANQMKWMWVASHPDEAYNMGMITAEQYKYRTGYDSPAAKATAAKSRSGGYYVGGNYSAPAQQTGEQKPTANGIV